MPNFKVTEERGFWDGVRIHPRGTIIALEPQDYKTHLSVTFEGMDPEAQKAVAKLRTEKKMPPNVPPEPDRTNGLDPHKREDLLKLSQRGVKAVKQDNVVEIRPVVPETVRR